MADKFHLAWFTWQGARDWEDPGRGANGALEWTKPTQWKAMAKVLEQRALFDMIIFADENAIFDTYKDSIEVYLKYALEGMHHDPLPLMAILAMHTRHIGLVSTLNTSVYPPYLLARTIGTLDHLTGGRMGWNIVTGAKKRSAQNLGLPLDVGHDDRYDIADKYVELCYDLWESWSEDAVKMDLASGRFAEAARLAKRKIGDGPFDAAGPLTMPRSPQGRPVIVQAGGSDRGRMFAATHAEIVITHQNTPADMKAFRKDIRDRMASIGRDPDSAKVFFTIKPIIGKTDEDAAAIRKNIFNSPAISVEVGLAQWSGRIGKDLSQFNIDEPLPASAGPPPKVAPKSTVPEGYSEGHLRQHYRDGKTPLLRDIALQEAIKETYTVQGDGKSVAQQMVDLMREVGGDGLAVRGSMLPRNVITFTDEVMPELRRLGVVRDAYVEGTLRDNLQAF